MNYIDKTDSLKRITERKEKIILELGCGNSKTLSESIAIDLVDLNGVDIVCDLNNGFPFIPDNSIDEIHSSHFMEHVNDFGLLMKEIYRILKPNGKNFIKVPHFSNPYFYSDYTHKNHFGLYSMSYFSKASYFRRDVPVFYNEIDFEIIRLNLKFKSQYKIKNIFLKVFERFVNSKKANQEFYEGNLTNVIHAAELEFLLKKKL